MQDVCLFAHFDRDDRVADYVLGYLRKIKELQFSIVFISTAKLPRIETERLRVDCSDVILRENSGLDFGSWSAGFAKHQAEINGRLLLANDSVYGPIGSLGAALDRLTTAPADFYGFVESIERTPHLQSWFLLFESQIVQSREFKSILSQPFYAMTKKEIIVNGELGLFQRLVNAGFNHNALYLTGRSGLAARFFPFNPTQVLWRELLISDEIPFLKIELLRDNPMNLEDQEVILSLVKLVDPSMYHPIKNHLARSIPHSTRRVRLSTLERRARQLRIDLIRKGYQLSRENRRLAEIWNFCKLSSISMMFSTWRMLRSARRLGHACKK